MSQSKLYLPSPEWSAQAHVKGMAGYQALVDEAERDYEGFWARQARELIEQLLEKHSGPAQLWNINFPETTPEGPRGVKVLPMGVHRYGEYMEKRMDPRGRTYYWSGSDKQLSPPCPVDTDVQGMVDGYITMTPLQFDMTQRQQLENYRGLEWNLNK